MTPPKENSHVHRQRKRFLTATRGLSALGLLGAVVVVLFGPACRSTGLPESDRQLRIAVNPWPGYAFLFLAEELGYFQAEGLDVRLIELASLADSRRVFEQGNADVIACSLVEVLLMNDAPTGDRTEAFLVCDYSDGGDILLARHGDAEDFDLRGKRIGLEPDSLDGFCVYLALQSKGLSISDVQIVPLAQSEMSRALDRNRVDAVQVYPPVSDEIAAMSHMHPVWDSSQAPWSIVDVLSARVDTLILRSHDLQRLARAYWRGQQYYYQYRADAEAILARRCRISPAGLRRSLGSMHIITADVATQDQLFRDGTLQRASTEVATGLQAIGMLRRAEDAAPLYNINQARDRRPRRARHQQ
jgi:NitT/TauT family transport system substrate-binding protein